ncbi:bromodomain-containing protein 8 [Epargyreus clarus]|uniref:bromodomain-containing protein 8 n=1 Tax=Epargyreus clarus TaxID=520877 RepID=UPI003C2B8D3F
MSSIQERLQLKRVPLDTWNVREQLCLASAVVRSGDQNWMSVSRALKTVGEPNRPPDWYSQKSCAAQYEALLEHVETPKRKKRSSEGAVETPQESILKRLTQDRILEIQKTLADMNQQYDQLKNEIAEAHNPSTSEERLQELWTGIESAKRARERESGRRAAWLKEREERRARAERTWRPPQTPPAVAATPPAPSSPLLTSLLKSSPVVTTPQHLPHPATLVETISPSAGAPTLSMLLEKPGGSSPHESKHAAIEHIKSQLVQIEQQLKANTTPPQPVPLAPAPSVDIDDIEIKAEDVYAFRDIDIHIPPVTAMHKGNPRPTEKASMRKEDVAPIEMVPAPQAMEIDEDKVEPPSTENINEEVLATEMEMPEAPEPEPEQEPEAREATPEPEVRISFPEVKFPTPEIKVIQPEVVKIKEDIREVEAPPPEEKQRETESVVNVEEDSRPIEEEVIHKPSIPEQNEEDIQIKIEQEEEVERRPQAEDSREEREAQPSPEETQIEKSPEVQETEVETEPPPSTPNTEVSLKEEREDNTEEAPPEESVSVLEEDSAEEKLIEDIKKEEDAEDSIPLKEMMKEDCQLASLPQHMKEEKLQEVEDTHTETDDDTPMELSREEEKDGKKKRDYSRKKKSDSRTRSGSESAPESPSAGDAERQHRLWRKSVMLVYSRLCAHKYASLFLRPISDEEAPGYSAAVKRPMDLSAVRRNIDSGVIRTTAEFQRDVLLMLSNALMYNSSEHSVYTMAKEMFEEAQGQLGMLLAAQAHAGLCCAPPRRKRKAPERH